MIRSFRDEETRLLFVDGKSRKFGLLGRRAITKLFLLNSAKSLKQLQYPPGNRLELLKGDRIGQHSIRVNDQYRICFVWRENAAWDVEIVDYH